jgi:Flp pilus assembly protein CpaB
VNKKAIIYVIIVCVLVLVGYLLVRFVVSKNPSQNQAITPTSQAVAIKKVDLSTQPDWVKKLVVTASGGRSANSLRNVTIKADGFPTGEVNSIEYVIQYETTNRGAQGALSSKPIIVNGATSFSKTIDLGTCSTKTCVTHDGVTNVDVELDFNSASGDQFTWSGTLPIN